MTDLSPKFTDEYILSDQTASITPEDIILFQNKPIPRVYSLVARPSQSIQEKLVDITDKIKQPGLGLYEYSPTQYHFTVIGDIPETYDPQKLVEMIKKVLERYNGLNPTFKGLQINLQGICTGVYFANNKIEKLRADFRRQESSIIDYSCFLPSLNKIGWLNIARFNEPFTPGFKNDILAHKETVFGSDTINSLELYLTTSKVLAPESSQLISTFSF